TRTIVNVVASQVYFTGYQALPLVITLAVATGCIVIMQASSQYNLLGGSNMLGQLMLIVVVREVGPLLTALIVIARSGTAVASELGNMKANREIEALEVMGINPLSFIVFPRLVGGILSVFCLALYFIFSAIFGGFLAARIFQKVAFNHYLDSIIQAFTMADIWLFALKVFFSGAIIFTVCCYQGLLVTAGPHEVPQVTTKAVVNSIIYVVGFNMIVTILFYLTRLGFL
ncbi:MAG: ABC transporter permease, partial [Bdellovibrionota bacterium]